MGGRTGKLDALRLMDTETASSCSLFYLAPQSDRRVDVRAGLRSSGTAVNCQRRHGARPSCISSPATFGVAGLFYYPGCMLLEAYAGTASASLLSSAGDVAAIRF